MGKIIIGTGFDLEGFRKGYAQLEKGVQSLAKKTGSAINSISKAFDSGKINKQTSAIESSSAAIMKQQALVDELKAKYDAIVLGEVAPASLSQAELELRKMQTEIDKGVVKLDELIAKEHELNAQKITIAGDDFLPPEKMSELTEVSQEIGTLGAHLDEVQAKADIAAENIQKIKFTPEASEEAQQLSSKLEIAAKKLEEMKNKSTQVGKAAPKAMKATGKEATKASKNVGGLGDSINKTLKRIKSLLVSALVFNVLRNAFREFRDYIGLAMQQNQAFANSFAQVKANLATAFQPILNVVVPALATLMSWLATATKYVVQFISAISGKSVKSMQDGAKGLDKLATATKNTGSASKKANKENEKMLATFDEINQLAKETAESTADSGGAGTGVVEPQYEEIPEPNMSWLDEHETFGGKLAAFLNNAIDSVDWEDMGRKMGSGINKIIDNAYDFLKEFDWKKFGSSIGTFLNSALEEIDWDKFGRTLGAGFSGFWTGVLSFIETFDWGNLIRIPIKILIGFLDEVDWADMAQRLSRALINVFNSIGKAIRETNWVELGQKLYSAIIDFITNIDWGGITSSLWRLLGNALGGIALFAWGVIKTAWEDLKTTIKEYFSKYMTENGELTIAGFLKGIWDAMVNIVTWTWDNVVKPFIDGFKEMFGIHSPSTVMAELGVFIMEGLFNGITSLVNDVVSIFSTLWEEIKGIWTVVSEWFNDNVIIPIYNFFSSFWEDIKTGFETAVAEVKKAWGKIADWFTKNVTVPIETGFKKTINFLIGLFEGFANGFIKAINFIINALNKISFDIPDWVPGIGGKSFGINISTVREISIPRLATGTVVPPNKEFLAILGDNKTEHEIVSPESKMKQAFKDAINEMGGIGNANNTPATVILEVDGRELGRISLPYINQEQSRIGVKMSNRAVMA